MSIEVDQLALPGHDLDCAETMLSQARLKRHPLDDVQVRHLLAIGYRAGLAAAEARGYRKAIAALRDQTAWTDYMLSRTDEDLYEHENLFAASFLEAIAEEGK